MTEAIRVLHLEDDPVDAELVQQRLEENDPPCRITRVAARGAYEEALRTGGWDVILADYRLPDYDGLSALRRARELAPDVPFLFVSGTMGEEAAIEALTQGATDYVLKHALSRLAPAVNRALREAENRRERKRAEDELRKLSRAVEQSANAILITDTRGHIVYANPSFAAMSGYSIAEVIGAHTRILKSGHTSDAEYAELWRSVTAGRQWRGVFLNKKKDGDVIWQSAAISPIRDEKGAITHFLAVEEDITDLRKAQEARAKLEDQLRHAQKLEALGTLAGGVAHDFNNILNVIVGYGELVQMHLAGNDPHRNEVAQILRAADRAAQLCRALLIFSRKETSQLKPLDVNDLIEGMRKMVLRLIGEDIETVLDLSPTPLTVMGDGGQLEQVLTNFATNARDAMPEGGVLTVKTDVMVMDRDFLRSHGFGAEGRYARIAVTDTGVGIDPETRERIFEPFFTTKGVGRGTGLGLSIAYGIIKQHKGFIECTSELGRGTTLTVYLPLLAREKVTEVAAAAQPSVRGGSETILIADDEESIRIVFREVLENFGYTVIEAKDGVEAVSRFRENQDRIDLVLLDAVMPKKGGKEAFEEIRALRPDVKALFATGYVGDASWREQIRDAGIALIQKPVRPRNLALLVREILDDVGK